MSLRSLGDYTRNKRTSATSTLVFADRCKFAGFWIFGRTASAGNKPHILIKEGSSTAGTILINISASSNYYTEEFYPWPLQSCSALFLEVSGSATGMAGISVFYTPELS